MAMPDDEEMLAELLIQWEELYELGQDASAQELCKEHPHLAEELTRRIAAMKATDWLNDPDPPADDPPASAVQPLQGRVLAGRYRLDSLVAEGGFAQVWRAYDTDLERIIAVKIPKRTAVGTAEAFLAEARRVARLKHPAILPVYDVGLEEGECFFVSEYVEGGSLADRLKQGRIPAEQVCRWIVSIADALDHAHRSGVIHRDVKPANILLDAHDRVLLADFGIAQSATLTEAVAPSLGTLRYMAPEQLAGQPALPQSDVYSLAVVLHEATAGRLPYASADPRALHREICAGATLSKDLPTRLAPACRKALRKDPGQRYGAAAEFAAEIRHAMKLSWRPPVAAAVAASLMLAAVPLLGIASRFAAKFSPATPLFTDVAGGVVQVDFVTVGDAGNPADANGFGNVDYEYRIGRYEITIEQYCVFLNHAAKSDPYSLYNEKMGTDGSAVAIERFGSDGTYTYRVMGEAPAGHMNAGEKLKPRRPIVCVSWTSAARFCNWLHNGQGDGDTEMGAYALNGERDRRVPREKDARFFLPTEDEWYKAAYYDPAGAAGNAYWAFATRSNENPRRWRALGKSQWDKESLELPNIANWGCGGGSWDTLAPVDSFPNATSAYGCHCMSGNVAEWVEPKGEVAPRQGMRRGGFWWEGAPLPNSAYRVPALVQTANRDVGFRIAAAAGSDDQASRIRSIRRSGSAAPQRSWSPIVKAPR
jgi:formylglycine-generating enzyme required for sulfatase activity/tRNA A-37 threonylcarbamoyl transferase component Bud32